MKCVASCQHMSSLHYKSRDTAQLHLTVMMTSSKILWASFLPADSSTSCQQTRAVPWVCPVRQQKNATCLLQTVLWLALLSPRQQAGTGALRA